MVAFLAIASAFLHKKEKSKELLDELVKRSEINERGVNINIVYVFNASGDFSSAKFWLNKAKQTNDVGLIWWQVDPLFKNFRVHLQEGQIQLPSADFPTAEIHIIKLLEAEMPKLPYHNIEHIYDVLNSALVIAENEHASDDEIKLLRLAALFHDAGFIHSPINHEARGAQMVKEMLPAFGFQNDRIDLIGKMILATKLPQSPATKLEMVLCDADLDYLGRDDFYEIGGRLLEEMKEQGVVESDREWNLVQRTFLQSHRYHTNYSKTNRESSKQERLQEIIAKLKNRS